MIKIVIQNEIAEQIRLAEGQVELVDTQGQRVGIVRQRPTQQEIEFAKSRSGTKGPKFSVDELITKVEDSECVTR